MMHDMWWYGDGSGWGWGGWILMGVVTVVFWAVGFTRSGQIAYVIPEL